MKTAGKKFTYTKKPTKISEFEIFILNPEVASLPTKACSYYWHHTYTGTNRFQDYIIEKNRLL
jgi:hypothetical protein